MKENINHTLLLLKVNSIPIAKVTSFPSIKKGGLKLHCLCLLRVYVLIACL